MTFSRPAPRVEAAALVRRSGRLGARRDLAQVARVEANGAERWLSLESK
eukprot:CAMPEP_0117562762 /NCGR_PEP_ID=MMETSP0784-20121206/55131_1 /TAXON_ID=39447 /ORGANISM="" /LENGTH=48 /DNA_ID= /DNA_START= /DNA_END= /DNA_ORIENTATION=